MSDSQSLFADSQSLYADSQHFANNNESNQNEEEEDGSDLDIGEPGDDNFQRLFSQLNSHTSTCKAYLFDWEIESLDSLGLKVLFPSSLLPLSLQFSYGFYKEPILFRLIIQLSDSLWNSRPKSIEISHPVYGSSFIGKSLITTVLSNFFSKLYQPKSIYKCASSVISQSGTSNEYFAQILVSEGFDAKKVHNALVMFNNSIEDARSFLQTGLNVNEVEIPISYLECPVLYLILEICEIYFDLPDHCCICRQSLDNQGLKPASCSKDLCLFGLSSIGVGNKVFLEIQRDPIACDLVFSVFCSAINTGFLKPFPPMFSSDDAANHQKLFGLIKDFPSMKSILSTYHNENEMVAGLGSQKAELLRWVLLSNRSQFISIPQDMSLSSNLGKNSFQFMALMSTPEKEKKFRALQQKHGSLFLFHGSATDRWYSILRNGLKNASGTSLQANGAALGAGIYFAMEAQTSMGYSRSTANAYHNSVISNKDAFTIISLCQVAQVPELKNHGWAHTLTNEDAVIVRFVFVTPTLSWNVISNPPTKIPSLESVLQYYAKQATV